MKYEKYNSIGSRGTFIESERQSEKLVGVQKTLTENLSGYGVVSVDLSLKTQEKDRVEFSVTMTFSDGAKKTKNLRRHVDLSAIEVDRGMLRAIYGASDEEVASLRGQLDAGAELREIEPEIHSNECKMYAISLLPNLYDGGEWTLQDEIDMVKLFDLKAAA